MANYTPNLNLTKRDGTESYSREQNNDNLDKIDTAIGDLQALIFTGDIPPAETNKLWYDTTTSAWKIYDGEKWAAIAIAPEET